jgi:hypothetical protein
MGRGGRRGRLAGNLRRLGAEGTRRGRGPHVAADVPHAGAGVAADTRAPSSRRGYPQAGAQVSGEGDSTKCPACGCLVLIREDARTLRDVVDQRYRAALSRFGDDYTAAARSLGVSRSTFYRWAERQGIRKGNGA